MAVRTFFKAQNKTKEGCSGGVRLTVVGRGGLDGSDGSVRVRVGASACGGSVRVSDSGAVCRGASGGCGSGLRVVASAGAQAGLGNLNAALSYNAPASASSVAAMSLPSGRKKNITLHHNPKTLPNKNMLAWHC